MDIGHLARVPKARARRAARVAARRLLQGQGQRRCSEGKRAWRWVQGNPDLQQLRKGGPPEEGLLVCLAVELPQDQQPKSKGSSKKSGKGGRVSNLEEAEPEAETAETGYLSIAGLEEWSEDEEIKAQEIEEPTDFEQHLCECSGGA